MSGTGVPVQEQAREDAKPVFGLDEDGIAGRIAAIRAVADQDAQQAGILLEAVRVNMKPLTEAAQHAPMTLALLDELEALVALLTDRHAAVAQELQAYGSRLRALHAYASRVVTQ